MNNVGEPLNGVLGTVSLTEVGVTRHWCKIRMDVSPWRERNNIKHKNNIVLQYYFVTDRGDRKYKCHSCLGSGNGLCKISVKTLRTYLLIDFNMKRILLYGQQSLLLRETISTPNVSGTTRDTYWLRHHSSNKVLVLTNIYNKLLNSWK